jgi:hypothetical protein
MSAGGIVELTRRETVVIEGERLEIIEVARQGPPGPPGKDATDPGAVNDAIEDWLENNDLPGTVRYDVAQSLKASDQEQAQENVGLTNMNLVNFYTASKA